MADIEVIHKLESKLPRKLKEQKVITWHSKGYIINEKQQVTHLSIFNVKLKGHFPDEIFLLKNLEYLDIRQNELAEIPSDISILSKLKYLDIRINDLSVLPPSFKELKDLEKLYLGANAFIKVPEEIAGLQNLTLLDLTENSLTSGIEVVFDPEKLTNIYLKDNRIKEFQYDAVPENKIKELNISGNPLTNIHDEFRRKIAHLII